MVLSRERAEPGQAVYLVLLGGLVIFHLLSLLAPAGQQGFAGACNKKKKNYQPTLFPVHVSLEWKPIPLVGSVVTD